MGKREWERGNGEWRMENEERRMGNGNGEWQMVNGKGGTRNGEWKIGNDVSVRVRVRVSRQTLNLYNLVHM